MVFQMKSSQRGASRVGAVLRSVRSTVSGWLGAPRFFYVIIGLLAFQAAWIALFAVYPQAFDENVHFGLIQLHADQWLPYFPNHIPGAEIYGPLSRDPSYLYHFLLSLPYRLIRLITPDEVVQVIVLRFLNIAMFVTGLYAYRRVLLALGLSRRMMHVVLLFFVLTPVTVLLAAHINYDNLIFPLTGWLFLSVIRFWKRLEIEEKIDVVALIQIFLIGIFGGIIKYTSLPLFAGLVVVLSYTLVRHFRRHREKWRRQLVLPGRVALVGYAALLIVGLSLFYERIGVNLVMYHSPSPNCAKVLSEQQCWSYSPWGRDQLFAQLYKKPAILDVAVYPFVWIHRMVFETMFVIGSYFQNPGGPTVVYIPAPPLTVANYTAWVIVIVGLLLLAVFFRRLWRIRYLRYILLAIGLYTAALFAKNAVMYLHSGEAVAIHGRYLVPMYPVLYAALALGFSWLFDTIRRPEFKVWLTIVVFILFLHGAALVAWLFRSTPEWYWSQQQFGPALQVNQAVQHVLHRIIIP
jgi:hypothetical protein